MSMTERASWFLNCPRCGLSIRPKATWPAIEHCPRCLARASVPVKLFGSPLPPTELYPEGSVPSGRPRETPGVWGGTR